MTTISLFANLQTPYGTKTHSLAELIYLVPQWRVPVPTVEYRNGTNYQRIHRTHTHLIERMVSFCDTTYTNT